MNPLRKVEDARFAKLIPQGIYSKVANRFKLVREGVARVEKASGIKYPQYYVEPTMILSTSTLEMHQLGVLFARTLPTVSEDHRIRIIVQLTAPLIAFGMKGTLHAILAHEFLHYLEMVGKIMKMETLSDEISGTLFEGRYADLTKLFDPETVFRKDRSLLRLITKKFPEGFQDLKLERKSLKLWLEKGLPSARISMGENIIRIPMSALASTEIDKNLRKKIHELGTVRYAGRSKRGKAP